MRKASLEIRVMPFTIYGLSGYGQNINLMVDAHFHSTYSDNLKAVRYLSIVFHNG